MNGLLHAIQNTLKVRFTYQKFWADENEPRFVAPLALKESINRWYVIGIDQEKSAPQFCLDRLSQLEIGTENSNARPILMSNKCLSTASALLWAIAGAREVLLAFRKPQSQYILTLPLHPSQTKIEETENEVVFRLISTSPKILFRTSFPRTTRKGIATPKSSAK